MQTVLLLLFGLASLLMVATLGALVGFGIRNVLHRRASVFALLCLAAPVALVLGLGLATADWARAGILTAIICFAGAVGALVVTGFRSASHA